MYSPSASDLVLLLVSLLLMMVGGFWVGTALQRLLPDHHRSRDSVESIRVVITLLVTFAAVVLGLLISSTHDRFTAIETAIRGLGIDITELDQRLRDYGPVTDPLRADLILYTKAAIADTWPDEPIPAGNYPRHLSRLVRGSEESVELSAVLHRIDLAIRRLTPEDELQRSIAPDLRGRMIKLLEHRLNLIEIAHPSISWPFLAIMMFWLAVIFVIAGLSSTRNLLVFTVMTLAALSLASSIFLALELDTPLTGFITISSAPLRDALVRITQPPLPAQAP